jgi:hypothetical protein
MKVRIAITIAFLTHCCVSVATEPVCFKDTDTRCAMSITVNGWDYVWVYNTHGTEYLLLRDSVKGRELVKVMEGAIRTYSQDNPDRNDQDTLPTAPPTLAPPPQPTSVTCPDPDDFCQPGYSSIPPRVSTKPPTMTSADERVYVFSAPSWNYDTSTDKMTDAKTYQASLKSIDSLSLDFPYSGANYGKITVRKHPSYGLAVIFSVDKGLFMCGVYDCTILVRFDDEKAVKWAFALPNDGSRDAMFARNPKGFVAKLTKTTRLLISVPMYQEGTQVLEFEAETPLKWPPAR